MDLLWAAVWTVRDGKAVRGQGYMAKAEALEAAGGGSSRRTLDATARCSNPARA
jgi:hypothetical protein